MSIDKKRVAEIWSSEIQEYGTGYLIADQYLLTAGHIVGYKTNIKVEVRLLGIKEWIDAHSFLVIETPDLAILKIDNKLDIHDLQPIKFGRLDNTVNIKCCAIGFPKFQEDDEGGKDTEQIDGCLKPNTLLKQKQNGYFIVDLEGSYPKNITKWKGISGAALFSNNLLVGVISTAPTEFIGARLKACSIDSLENQSQFKHIFGKTIKLHTIIDESYKEKGLGIFDETRTNDSHFQIQLDEANQCDIFDFYVEPNYRILSYNDNSKSKQWDQTGNFIQQAIELVDTQKILVISGNYGCGKTFSSKIIQLELTKNKRDIIFINCSNIAEEDYDKYNLFLKAARERKSDDNSLYIIFDGYDEINFLKKDKADIRDKILKNIVRLSKESGFYIILNTRPTPLLSSNDDLLKTYKGNPAFFAPKINISN